jgi:hypothetical protein
MLEIGTRAKASSATRGSPSVSVLGSRNATAMRIHPIPRSQNAWFPVQDAAPTEERALPTMRLTHSASLSVDVCSRSSASETLSKRITSDVASMTPLVNEPYPCPKLTVLALGDGTTEQEGNRAQKDGVRDEQHQKPTAALIIQAKPTTKAVVRMTDLATRTP